MLLRLLRQRRRRYPRARMSARNLRTTLTADANAALDHRSPTPYRQLRKPHVVRRIIDKTHSLTVLR